MVIKMFAVYDSKAKAYSPPVSFTATGLAIRWFTDVVNDPKSSVSRYPEDFSLFEVGMFDDNTGELARIEKPLNLGIGSAYVRIRPVGDAPMLPGMDLVTGDGALHKGGR